MTTSQHWKAAIMLLDAPSLRRRTLDYCDAENEYIDPSILETPWSSGERTFIELALSLTDSNYKVNLDKALESFTDQHTRRILAAFSVAMCGRDLTTEPDQSACASASPKGGFTL